MAKIQVLDTKLANMIAAGEVVERPSSVLKELVENSIDAGAKNISVYVYEAGRRKIIIEDDGSGMDREDALLSLKRHATSKLSSTFDLFRIKTLGFRGEALPSIASVSKMKIVTSTGSNIGTELEVIDENVSTKDASLRKGTIIEVSELFYNTPARLKYLKTDYTENANNIEVMNKLALAHPEVAIEFYIDDKVQFKTTGRNNLLEAIADIYGYTIAKSMVPISFEGKDYKVEGFLGKPDIAKASRYFIITLLNGRSVYMPKVQNAIKDGYLDYIAPSKYPFVVLNFIVDHSLVDVNVHPSKREVRFSKEDELRLALLEHIPQALKPRTMYDEVSIKSKVKEEVKIQQSSLFTSEELNKAERGTTSSIITFKEKEVEDNLDEDLFEEEEVIKETPKIKTSPIRPLAQLNKTYIIGEDYDPKDGGFYLIDQHAAMERVNYEYFTKLYEGSITTMSPLFPEVINLNPSEVKLFTDDKIMCLKEIGLEFEAFGINAYKVITIPTWIKKEDQKEYVDELINMALHDDKIDSFKLKKHAIATMACKASLKANMECSIEELKVLLDRLFNCENPHNCPHGRPIIIKFSKYELEKLFKRTGI